MSVFEYWAQIIGWCSIPLVVVILVTSVLDLARIAGWVWALCISMWLVILLLGWLDVLVNQLL